MTDPDPMQIPYWSSSDKQRQWQRPLLAGENMWMFRQKQVREMFLWTTVLLSSPIPSTRLVQAIRQAWCLLRSKHPEMACSFGQDGFGNRYMRYEVPSHEELQKWACRTLILETSERPLTFLEARQKLCLQKSPENGANLHLSFEASEETGGSVTEMGILFNMDHMYTDGIGIRILAGRFFETLSNVLASPEKDIDFDELDLSETGNHLSPPYTSLMNSDQKFEGESYKLALTRQQKFLLELAPKNWGLLVLPNAPAPAETKLFFHSFIKEESQSLLQCVKEKLGSSSTINHLAHAAMVIAMLRAHPPPPSHLKTTLYSPSWMNGRRYLREGYRDFFPNCRAMGEVIFHSLGDYFVGKDAPQAEVKVTLMRACVAACESYQNIREQKSLLSESIPLMEYLGDQMAKPYGKTEETAKQRQVADPFFLADGKEETHISHTYNPTLTIHDLSFAANAEGPNIRIIRLSSWRDTLTLSGEWIDSQYITSDVHAFLKDIVGLMLVLGED